jgi:hypothetical protein
MGFIGGGGYPQYVFIQATAPTATRAGQLWSNTADFSLYQSDSGLAWVNIGLNSAPVGSIFAWLKSFTNTPALNNNWVECNGQVLSDAASLYNGLTLPDLNNSAAAGVEGRYLRGHTSSGITQASQNLTHSHAISIYDSGTTANVPEGGSTYRRAGATGTNGGNEARPYSYTVVWIMRVK